MCGRYTIAKSREVLARLLGREIPADLRLPAWNASPGQHLPVVLDRDPGRVVGALWGLRPSSPRLAGRLLINARSETVHQKPLFRDSLRRRRCLVIADGFYEWQKREDGKQPFRITRTDEGVFAFAGIWVNAESGPVFLILTTEPNRVTQPIHDRMPVMLEDSEQTGWLDHDLSVPDVLKLLDPYPSDEMVAYAVSRAVNNSKNDSADLIRPIEQFRKSDD